MKRGLIGIALIIVSFAAVAFALPEIIRVPIGTSPTVDGIISPGEYSDANSVTFSTSGGTCTVYFKHDMTTFYVAFDVPNKDSESGVQVFVDTLNDKAILPQPDDYRFTISRRSGADEYGENKGTGTGWTPWGPPVGWTGAHQDLASTWNAEFAIPFTKLGIAPKETIGIAFCNCWTATGDHYWPSGATWDSPSTWGEAYFATPVGGIMVPIDKLSVLAPYIGLTLTIVVATVAAVTYTKRRKEKQ